VHWAKAKALLLTVGFAACVVSAPASAQDTPEAYQVVANHKTQALPAKDIKKLLTGQQSKWPDGTPVVLVLPPAESEAVAWACEHLLRMPRSLYFRYVKEKAFRGSIAKPIEVSSEAAVAASVGAVVGAIAIVPVGAVTGDAHPIAVQ